MWYSDLIDRIRYYFWSSYRRRSLDKLQNKYSYLYKGIVADIGGRDRGRFKKPKTAVLKWIFIDIEKKHKPDLIQDVSKMNKLKKSSVDVINAIELFEHVYKIEAGLRECFRVLKKDGTLILSVPFMYPVHADPEDFQRWTNIKLKKELGKIGFAIIKINVTGTFFTVSADMIKSLIRELPLPFRYFGYLCFPFLDLIVNLDNTAFIKKTKLANFHGGYFIIAKKII